LESLQTLKTGLLSRFCSTSALNLVQATYDSVLNITNNMSIEVRSMTSPALKKVKEALTLYCREQVQPKKTAAGQHAFTKTITGASAASAKLKALQDHCKRTVVPALTSCITMLALILACTVDNNCDFQSLRSCTAAVNMC
jgi:hypothetical protein